MRGKPRSPDSPNQLSAEGWEFPTAGGWLGQPSQRGEDAPNGSEGSFSQKNGAQIKGPILDTPPKHIPGGTVCKSGERDTR